MKAKKHTRPVIRTTRRDNELLPHELGAHLFAVIRRNLLARRQPPAPQATQLTFAFQ
jgi:hypothetical protein